MKYIKTPMKGMCDFLPAEMEIREYVISQIKETYATYGFSTIETPCIEHIENLTSKQGGENEKLIFKIMKRGAKLAAAEDLTALADSGLRYDLTVPLSRYYANNMNDLTAPFKALQIGNVWRADRPQKGRFRQFVQCDIDIIGDASIMAEVELIAATTDLLGKLGFRGFQVRVNDRRILKAMAAASGFLESDYDKVFIILDKMDKIGPEGVRREFLEAGFDEQGVDRYLKWFESEKRCTALCAELPPGLLDADVASGVDTILACARQMQTCDYTLRFDPTLVRGMSYYTGTIFEIELAGYPFSIAGGGRYDEMIGHYCGTKVCACGFSIGFERIITILNDQGFAVPFAAKKIAFLVEQGMPADKLCRIFEKATQFRREGHCVAVYPRNKNVGYQKDKLRVNGYAEFEEFYKDREIL